MRELEEIKIEIEKQIGEVRKFKNGHRSLQNYNEPASAIYNIEYDLIHAKIKLEDLIKYMGEDVSETV